jgi:hypothetical protein
MQESKSAIPQSTLSCPQTKRLPELVIWAFSKLGL